MGSSSLDMQKLDQCTCHARGVCMHQSPSFLQQNTDRQSMIHDLAAQLDKQIKEQLSQVEKEKEEWEREKQMMKRYDVDENGVIELNVGGTRFQTMHSTLAKQIHGKGHILSSIVSGKFDLVKDKKGAIFLDRNPEYFKYVLDYLRADGDSERCEIPWDSRAVRAEFDFFAIDHGRKSSRTTWKLDPLCKHNSLTLSNDELTVKKAGSYDHATVIGDTPLMFGVHQWTVEILQLAPGNSWAAVGVTNKSMISLGQDYNVSHCASSISQLYNTTGPISNWNIGDKIHVVVDCNSKTLSIKNGSHTNLSADISTALAGGDLYPFFNLYADGNRVRISTEE